MRQGHIHTKNHFLLIYSFAKVLLDRPFQIPRIGVEVHQTRLFVALGQLFHAAQLLLLLGVQCQVVHSVL